MKKMLEKDLLTDVQLDKLIKFLKQIKYSRKNLVDDLLESTIDIYPEKKPYQKSEVSLDEIIHQISQQYDINWIVSYLSSHIYEQFEKTISQGQVQAIIKRILGITLTSTERSQLHELRKKVQRYERFLDSFGKWGKGYDHRLKIIMLGLKEEYSENFLDSLNKIDVSIERGTVGVDFYKYAIEGHDKSSIILQIWNIADDKRFEFLRKQYYHGSAGIVLFFNKNNYESFEKIKVYISELREITNLVFVMKKIKKKYIKLPIALVGIGESNVVPEKEIKSIAEEIEAEYYDISSKGDFQIPEILKHLSYQVLTRLND